MIIKGKARSGSQALGNYLQKMEKNERVTILEIRGTFAQDLVGALNEMDAYAEGTKCEKPLYHAIVSPEPPHHLTPEQREASFDALEKELGFEGQPRVVVRHEKKGSEHYHLVWARIDLETGKAIHLSQNYRKHEQVARALEKEFGHNHIQGAHAEREGKERPPRSLTRSEIQIENKTGIKGKTVRAEVTRLFHECDTPQSFAAALDDAGYLLARGDRRDYIIIDRRGGTHSLARRIEGVKAAELREFMKNFDPSQVPSAEKVAEIVELRMELAKAEDAQEDAATLERKYGKGADYVSQSRAALFEHKQRQAARGFEFFDDKIVGKMRAYMEQHPEKFREATGDAARNSDRQPEVPGGKGHTRSR